VAVCSVLTPDTRLFGDDAKPLERMDSLGTRIMTTVLRSGTGTIPDPLTSPERRRLVSDGGGVVV
jgi:hypothetical protein